MRLRSFHLLMRGLVSAIVLQGPWQVISAQDVCFSIFDTEDGLPSARITALTQDQHGHLWVGTELGIARFNGYSFQTFYDEASYRPGKVNDLVVDSSQQIWIGTTTGLSVYKGNEFRQVEIVGLDTASIQYLLVDHQNRIFISTLHQLHILSHHGTDSQTIVSHQLPNPWFLTQGFSGRIWQGTLNEILQINDQEMDTIFSDPSANPGGIMGMLEIQQGLLFGTKSDDIYLLDQSKPEIELVRPFNDQNHDFRSFVEWQGKTYAVYGWGIVDLFDGSAEIMKIPHQWNIKFINMGFVDLYGDLWLGTTEGLILMRKSLFKSVADSILPTPIYGLYEDRDQRVWLGGRGAIYQFDTYGNLDLWQGPIQLGGEIMDITEDQEGNLWLASYWQGIVHLRGETPIHLTSEEISFLGPDIWDLFVDDHDNLWMGTTRGLFKKRAEDTTYSFLSFHNRGIPDHCDVYKITQHDAYVYAASSCGLYRMSSDDPSLVFLPGFRHQPQIRGLHFDENNLWLATVGHGVLHYEMIDQQLQLRYTFEETFPSILDMVGQGSQIWAGGPNGLLKIDRDQFGLRHEIYSPTDGFFDKGFSHLKLLLTSRGELFAASSRGIRKLETNHQRDHDLSRNIIFDEILLNGDKIDSLEDSTTFPSNTRTVEVSYYYPDLTESRLVKYRWRMADQSPWSPWSTDRKMVLYNPKHGSYHLEIQAKKANQILAQGTLSFVIETPFLQKGEVIFSGILLTGFLIYLYNRRRHEHFRLKQKIDNERALLMANLEAKALRSQMSPHFLFNILNNLQELIISGENQLAQNYLTKFSRLMRMILNISAKEFVRIEKEIEFLKLYLDLESLRFDHNFNYEIQAHPDLETIEIPVFMVQPLVENAIKHGLQPQIGERNLVIRFKHQGEFLMIKVQDNGVGMSQRVRMGNVTRSNDVRALDLLSDRIAILSQKTGMDCTLSVESNKSSGVTSEIRLPLLSTTV